MKNSKVKMTSLIAFGVAAICLCLSETPLDAQTVGGTILGLVRDPQGSAIAKAEVSTRNIETGAIRTTTADGSGSYRISSIPAGSYEISSSAAGFKTEVRTGIVVTVGSDVSVNFSLTIGAITEQVQVTGEATQVDTSSSTMGGFVNSSTIRELPLNGRDWMQLALLQPGVNLNPGQNTASRVQKGNGLAISISGGRPTDNAFRIDGLLVNDYANAGPGSTLGVNMGVDAIREFSVLTSSYSAEYGRGSGGVVNAITKSGTNQIHGSAYYFHRNSALDARNFFDPATIPVFRRHQFGGSLGGSIKKDKTFFFTNYEALTEKKSLSLSNDTLSANAHNGLLCANPACTSTNQIAIHPSVAPYLALFPLPNGPVTGNTGKFLLGAGRLGNENYVLGKIDHYFSPATSLSGSYSYDNTSVTVPDAFNLKVVNSPARKQNVVLSLQHVFSPSLVNITRVGVSRTFSASNLDQDPRNPAISDSTLGFVPGRPMGRILISGVSGTFGGLGANGINLWGYTAPQFYNDLSWTKGRHSLRTGFSVERIYYNTNSASSPNGNWNFTSIQGFLQATALQFSSDFPGTDTIRGERMSIVAGYLQDDFRVRSNLTLNLGVRYEMGTVLKEVNGKIASLRSITDSNTTVGDPYYNNPTLKNFAPRVGFAWDPFKDGKTAIRGGAGMFDIIPLPYLFILRMPRSTPFFQSGTIVNPPVSSFPNQVLPLLTLNSLQAAHIEFNPSRSYRAQWNLNIQRQLTRSMALTVGYLGAAGVHLARQIFDTNQVPPSLVKIAPDGHYVFPVPGPGQQIQRINPNFGIIGGTAWNGHSSYHALQTNLVQRPTKGLSYQVAYTWSKSIDNGTTTGNDGGESANSLGVPWAFDPRINRGVSDFHVAHNFVANFLYEVPVPGAVRTHALSNALLGGWQVGGIYTRQSGGVFSLKDAGDRAFTGNSAIANAGGGQSPDYVNAPGCNPNAITGDINNYIMTQCFAFPAPGVIGNLGRNTLRMPVFRDLTFSAVKNQNLFGEKLRAQFRVELFNALNNTNLQAQTLTIFDGNGNLTSGFGTARAPTVNSSRQIQMGLRFLF